MRRFFETHKLDNACLPEERVKMIRLSVLSRVKEEQQMRKRFKIKPLIIAAAAIATMAASAVTVNALSSGEDPIFKINGKIVNGYYTSYVDENDRTVEIYFIEYPEEILVDPPADCKPGPVGELKAVYDYNSLGRDSMYIGVIDETGKEFIDGECGTSFFGKEIFINIEKEGEPGYMISWGRGIMDVDPEYDMDYVLDMDKKIFSMEYHKNLFNTIGDFFKGE